MPHPRFEELVQIMARLRAPDGCPWDREQTHATLRSYLLEESHEAIEAVDAGDDGALCEELGDVLLQIVFHAQIAAEQGRFTIDDVCGAIADKLVRRHPHVFGDVQVRDADHVKANWDQIKRGEKGAAADTHSALDGVPAHLPALLRAQRLQERASQKGFDWDRIDGPLDKVAEELEEVRGAWAAAGSALLEPEPRRRLEEEFGDLLFALVNAARFLKVTPEDALRRAAGKFETRFREVEKTFRARGRDLDGATLEEMDAIWDQVKEREGH
ncbi:MAG: nucleoside triphosphate pyrophosphohydrolase [Gemmatimonadota bacterium]